jgi:hypothetical protein
MSKYIAPSLRNKQEPISTPEPETPPEKKYEDEFPALGVSTNIVLKPVWNNGSFADKAREMSIRSKEEQEEKERKKLLDTELTSTMNVRTLPRFNNIHRYVEQEPESESEKEEEKEEEEWITVSNKRRNKKRKVIEELIDNIDNDNPEPEENQDSVWNQDAEANETCWDDKHY